MKKQYWRVSMTEEIRKYEPQAGIVHGVVAQEEMGQGTDDKGLKPSGPEIRREKKKIAPNTIELKDVKANEVEAKINDNEDKKEIENPVKTGKTYQQVNTPKEQEPIEQLSADDIYKGNITDDEAKIYADIFQYMYDMTNRNNNIIMLATSPKLEPEIKSIGSKKPYWRFRLRHPDTKEILETHRYKKLPDKVIDRLGSMALRDNWSEKQFKNVGKISHKIAANKIRDIVLNSDKYIGITKSDTINFSNFVKSKFNKAFPKQYEGEQAHENIGLDNSKNKIGDKQEPITAKSLSEKMLKMVNKYGH